MAFYELLDDSLGGETKGDANAISTYFGPVQGGGYTGFPAANGVVGIRAGQSETIQNYLAQLLTATQAGDKILLSTQGHGSPTGLQIGMSHQDFVSFTQQALYKGALEVTIMVMACYSGGLVNAFDQTKLNLKDYQRVVVMTSSTVDQESSSYDGKHSAFGQAVANVFQQLISAPTSVMTLNAFWSQVKSQTQELGGHDPVLKTFSGANQSLDSLKMFCGKSATDPDCQTGLTPTPNTPSVGASDIGVMLAGTDENAPKIVTSASVSLKVASVVLCQATLAVCRQNAPQQSIPMTTATDVILAQRNVFASQPMTNLATGATYALLFRDASGTEVGARSFTVKKK